jgi:hypothetical protein
MIFHEPALADLDAIALDHEARTLFLSGTAKRLFEGGPRRPLRLSADLSVEEGAAVTSHATVQWAFDAGLLVVRA